jgi:hypothetical protein
MKHFSFKIRRQNPTLGCSIFLQISPNLFSNAIDQLGVSLNQQLSLNTISEKTK